MTEPLVQELAWREPHEAFHAFADEPFALFLDSATAGPGRDPALHGRWSFIAADPADSLTLRIAGEPAPFAALKARLATLPLATTRPGLPPFIGGAAGFLGYGLGRTLERLPPETPPFAVRDRNLPDMALGIYDAVLAFDMIERRAWAISTGAPERAARLRARFEAAAPLPPAPRTAPAAIASNFTRAGYERAAARVIDYIHAGDIFQANLSQRFEARLAEGDTPYALYLRLRAASPAPFGAFFNFGEGAILSSSPERFLACRGGAVETRPIKGTRPRGLSPAEDRHLAAELLASEKDRAENVMIVDLLRNDISRVCADGSVTVEKLCALESFANVHHLVSTVRGRLRADATPVDLLAACFPGGSITGAPKLRAMEIIAELEPTARGPYCGAIGYLGADGAMDTSIAIRTMVVSDGCVTFQAGGGIVADSDPAAEYEETLDKARDMRHVLEGLDSAAPEATMTATAGATA
ncbi:aminodeoxychorismate synthase component I [Parvibaculum sp.]|uniref:aminodeoxychorismate synthase component I n=1 Tax=Parvibaculum sp. TaxID=2024848 RepID=UPI0034A0973C